jgi:tetratricopeptide (TPR) repeat protein
MKLRTLRAGLTLLWVSALSFSALGATDEERASARSLANQAISAFKEKRYSNAADLFQRAESLVHSPVHLLYLGRALTATGNLVRAQEAYLKAAREPITPASPPAFSKAVDDATAELETLRPRLAQLQVNVSGLSRGETPEVLVDGERIPPAMVGVFVPVDPGQHRVEAKAARYLPAWRKFSVAEGQTEKITLNLESDPDAAAAPSEQPGTPTEGTSGASETDTTTAPKADSGGNPVFLYSSLGALAIGVAGTGWGLYHVVRYSNYYSQSEGIFNQCPDDPADPQAKNCSESDKANIRQLDSKIGSEQRRMIAPFVVGGVGLLLGTTLLVLYANSADSPSAKAGIRVEPWIGFNSLGVRGTF